METHIEMSERRREAQIEVLEAVTASSLQLSLLAKMAHWNLKGPEFVGLHALFDEIAEHTRDQADTAAERAAALGAFLETDAGSVAEHSPIGRFPGQIRDGLELAGEMADRLAAHADAIRDALTVLRGDLGDPAGENLLADILLQVEKDVWMLESHIQGDIDEVRAEEEESEEGPELREPTP